MGLASIKDFDKQIERKGWRSFKVTTGERDDSCWIDPEGNWYNVPFCDHDIFAWHVLKELKKLSEDDFLPMLEKHKAVDQLINEFGWICIHSDVFSGTLVHGANHMNKAQYDSLLEHFGDSPLFRGWTIDSMWKQSEHYE